MQTRYDFVVIGATLEGLFISSYLKQQGFSTLILEPSNKSGGQHSSPLFTSVSFDNAVLELLNSLNQKLKLNLNYKHKSSPPLTFEKGSLEPFVGFGEIAPKEAVFFQDFLFAQKMELFNSLQETVDAILSSGIEIQYGSQITALGFSDTKLDHILINDSKTIHSDHFIFTLNPTELVPLLDVKNVSQKTLTRLSKTQFWSTLLLDFVTKAPVTDKTNFHILYGTQKNPIFCIGMFSGNKSQWASLIASDSPNISENGADVLKEMKRQIKRAYPNAFENIEFEKISLLPNTHGHVDLKSKVFGQLEGVENLSLCSSHLIEQASPIVGALVAAERSIALLENTSAVHSKSIAHCENIPLQS